jgi:hypothetical protein
MPQFFPHEKLQVYSQALSFAKLAAALIDSWPSIMAVCDQLDRATESLVTNLAKAARLRATEHGIYCLECSLGSDHSKFLSTAEDAGVKLAAYLDLVEAASLMEAEAAKSHLREVMAMLGGLRGYLEAER